MKRSISIMTGVSVEKKSSSSGVASNFLFPSWTSTAFPLHNFSEFITSRKVFFRCFKNSNGLRMQISVLINSNHRYQIIIPLNTVARKDAPVFLRVWEVVQIVLNFAVVEIFVKIKNFSEYKFFEENYYFIRLPQEF